MYLSYKNGYSDIYKVSPVLEKLDMYHFVNVKNSDLIAQLVPILEKMKKSGEIKHIRRYYLRELVLPKR